jgi:hypothetical protein
MSESEDNSSSSSEESLESLVEYDGLDKEDEQLFRLKQNLRVDVSKDEEEQEDEGWNEYYNADQDDAMEELEASRLQKEQTLQLKESDIGDIWNTIHADYEEELDSKVLTDYSKFTDSQKLDLIKSSKPLILELIRKARKLVNSTGFCDLLYLSNLIFGLACLVKSDYNPQHPVFNAVSELEKIKQKLDAINSQDNEDKFSDQSLESEAKFAQNEDGDQLDKLGPSDEKSSSEHDTDIEEYKPIKRERFSKRRVDKFGENEEIAEHDMNDKIANKKSLKFHVNRVKSVNIEQLGQVTSIKEKVLKPTKGREPEEDVEDDEQEAINDGLDPDLEYYYQMTKKKQKTKITEEPEFGQNL